VDEGTGGDGTPGRGTCDAGGAERPHVRCCVSPTTAIASATDRPLVPTLPFQDRL
jgi:hypothetical protein